MSRLELDRGFTIVEFMIASSVFGIILLVISAAILSMNQSYQKSMYASRTQEATSNLVDAIAQSIKYSPTPIVKGGAPADGTTSTFCIGNRQFLYVLGKQMDGSEAATTTKHVVVSRLNTDNCATMPSIITATPSGSPKELLGKGMRLAALDIDDSKQPLYTVTARVVYGDDDSLCSDSIANSCADNGSMPNEGFRKGDLRCRAQSGSQFCAVSELSTTVYRRL